MQFYVFKVVIRRRVDCIGTTAVRRLGIAEDQIGKRDLYQEQHTPARLATLFRLERVPSRVCIHVVLAHSVALCRIRNGIAVRGERDLFRLQTATEQLTLA